MKKKGHPIAVVYRLFLGTNTTQLYGDYNQPWNKDLYWNNQASMESKAVIFSWLNETLLGGLGTPKLGAVWTNPSENWIIVPRDRGVHKKIFETTT